MKTVSFETAKKLKEAGWNKETDFYWCEDKYRDSPISTKLFDKDTADARKYNSPELNIFPAPTLDELFKEMPNEVFLEKELSTSYRCFRMKYGNGYRNANPTEAVALLWLDWKETI